MAVNKVEICGLDTSKLPMMTYERSTELLKKISEGDEEARDIFIKENLRLVLSVIQRFSGRGEQMDDLFQVGCIGLIKAILGKILCIVVYKLVKCKVSKSGGYISCCRCIGRLFIYIIIAILIGLVLRKPFEQLNHYMERSKENSGVML